MSRCWNNDTRENEDYMKDTAEIVGTVSECLYSLGNRVAISKLLVDAGETKLLETELEDIAYFVQCLVDEHCVRRNDARDRNRSRAKSSTRP